jgi:hypothetical protein
MPDPNAVKTVPFDPDADPGTKTTVNQNNHDTNAAINTDKVVVKDGKTQEELDHEAAMLKKAESGTDNANHNANELFAGKYETKEEFDKAILSAYHKKHGDKVEEAFKTLTGDLSQTSDADKKVIDSNTDANTDADAKTDNDDDSDNDDNVDLSGDMSNFVQEFNKDGKLSDESYTKLETAGFDRAMVNTYMAGIATQRDALFEIVGGKGNFFQMTEWAAEDGGMSEGDIKLFNEDLNTGEPAKMSRAVNTLKTAFDGAGKKTAPALRLEPKEVNTAGGVVGYTHIDELKADQANPQYKKSAAFRAGVKEKIRLGNI